MRNVCDIPDPVRQVLNCAEADLQGLLPAADPDGERTHPGWTTLGNIAELLAQRLRVSCITIGDVDYHDVDIEFFEYDNDGLAIYLTHEEEGAICVATSWVAGIPAGCVAIKLHGGQGEIDKELQDIGLLGDKVTEIPSGHVSLPVYELKGHALEAWNKFQAQARHD